MSRFARHFLLATPADLSEAAAKDSLRRGDKEADRIRDELKAMGIELEDHKDGTTTWKVKR